MTMKAARRVAATLAEKARESHREALKERALKERALKDAAPLGSGEREYHRSMQYMALGLKLGYRASFAYLMAEIRDAREVA